MKLEERKAMLYRHCQKIVQEKIHHAKQAILTAKDAASDDTKSSAGDKYETTREMMQQEIDRNEHQLAEANRLKHQLEAVSVQLTDETVQLGSLVETSGGLFFIAVALGKVEIEKDSFVVISPISPLGRLLVGKSIGDTVSFNKHSYQILTVG